MVIIEVLITPWPDIRRRTGFVLIDVIVIWKSNPFPNPWRFDKLAATTQIMQGANTNKNETTRCGNSCACTFKVTMVSDEVHTEHQDDLNVLCSLFVESLISSCKFWRRLINMPVIWIIVGFYYLTRQQCMLGQVVGMFDLGKEQFVSHEC